MGMIKHIKGKKYNTSTADLKATWTNGLSENDLEYCKEYLYQKRTGEFFLHGYGGALTMYGRKKNKNGIGENIIPLTFEETEMWANKKLDEEGYNNVFGYSVIEGGDSISTSFILPNGFLMVESARCKLREHAFI